MAQYGMKFNRTEIEAAIGQQNDGLRLAVVENMADDMLEQWAAYLTLLRRWNKVYNLTSVRSVEQMQMVHLYDSLSVASFVQAERIADIGSGGGLPGIPLAILYPGKMFTLIDTNSKKTRFLRQVVIELELSNVDVIHSRVEDYALNSNESALFGQIVSRAFTSLHQFVTSTQHLLKPGGEWLAMKGRYPDEELKEISPELAYTVTPLEVLKLEAERHLVRICARTDKIKS